MIPIGRSSVLDCISGVISIGIIMDNGRVIAAANNIEEDTSLAPKNIDCLSSFLLPNTEFNEIDDMGPIRGDINIAPIITATLLDTSPAYRNPSVSAFG